LRAFAEHGQPCGDTVTGTAAHAHSVFDALTRIGIDLTDTFLTLENDGVAQFENSWADLGDTVSAQLAQAAG
jgi:transaldolase